MMHAKACVKMHFHYAQNSLSCILDVAIIRGWHDHQVIVLIDSNNPILSMG